MIKNQFIPYSLALKLKELGFDLKCLAYYVIGEFENEPLPMGTVCGPGYGDIHFGVFMPKYQYAADDKLVATPLWQQVFDWFNEEFYLMPSVQIKSKGSFGSNYYYEIKNHKDFVDDEHTIIMEGFKGVVEARQACLEKLIELTNKKV